jgi:hypothetical protein
LADSGGGALDGITLNRLELGALLAVGLEGWAPIRSARKLDRPAVPAGATKAPSARDASCTKSARIFSVASRADRATYVRYMYPDMMTKIISRLLHTC